MFLNVENPSILLAVDSLLVRFRNAEETRKIREKIPAALSDWVTGLPVPAEHVLFNEIIAALKAVADDVEEKKPLRTQAKEAIALIEQWQSRQGTAVKTVPQQDDPVTRGNALKEELRKILGQVGNYQQPLVTEFTTILKNLKGVSYTDYTDSADLILLVNNVRRHLGLAFKMTDDDNRVNVRCVNSPRSKGGIYQTVTTTSAPSVLYNGKAFPELAVFQPPPGRKRKS